MIAFPNGIKADKDSPGRPGRPGEPEGFDDYRRRGGYEALGKAIREPSSTLIATIDASGLGGRGGAGFPTGRKWRIAAETDAKQRYLVCNAGEDEPGSFKDRVLLESSPHLILEGMILGAYAIGATRAYLYLNETYKHSNDRMSEAISEASAAGYLGDNILGSGFALEVVVHPAPTVYVAGEDSASLEVLEGRDPMPREKPPYPAVAGLFGMPTVVNNVETLAHVAPIVRNGAEWYQGFGVKDRPGTMIFCLGPEVEKPGAYELPVGTTTRSLLETCGGGLRNGARLKAFLPGGPSCAFLLDSDQDVALDPASLKAVGSSLGCGVMRFFPEGTCMLEPTLELAQFFARESCGQCSACRMETMMLSALVEKIRLGQGDASLYDQIPKVLEFNRGRGFCALVDMPGPPLLSAIKLFRADFDYHLEHGECGQ